MITEEQLRTVVKVLKGTAVEASSRVPLVSPVERLGIALTLLVTASVEIQEELQTRFGSAGRQWLADKGFEIGDAPPIDLDFEPVS